MNYYMGKLLDKENKFSEAIPFLNKAIEANPESDDAYFNLALSYTNLGDHEKGLNYFLKVIEINPQRGEAYYYVGLIFKERGDGAKAGEYSEKAQQLGFADNTN